MPINIPTTNVPRIVIIGGGFAGLELAKKLRHLDGQIVLIDKNNYHAFQPLLYQVATAGLEPDSIAYPLRKIFKNQQNIIFRMAEVIHLTPEKNSIETSIGEIHYDYLVLAIGSRTDYFGMEDFKARAMPMKSVPEALNLRSLILQNFEGALLSTNLEEREGLMNFVIVGGGPTGVEMAGALGELKNHILPLDYPELDLKRMQIHLIDLKDRLLESMSPEASLKTKEYLKRFDVNIWLNTKVLSFDGTFLTMSNGKKLLSKTVIWAAGVTGCVIPGLRPGVIVRGNRIKVDVYNRVEGYQNIFAVGDVAAMATPDYSQGHPMLASVANQQGQHLGNNLYRLFQKEAMKPFRYCDLGVMATIGRNRAVADLVFLKTQGFFAWLLWLFIHLMLLVGFRNRVVTFVNWVWSYFSYDRGLRLIIRPFKR